MIERVATTLLILGGMLAVACVDMAAPRGAASISLLQLPWPAVVVNDVMKDSNGVPSKLGLIAYDGSGTPISGLTPQFFITDSAPAAAHFDADGILHGDKVGTVHVVGQVSGLETPPRQVWVSVAPDTVVLLPLQKDTIVASFTADSANPFQFSIPVAVRGAGNSPAPGFLVSYALQHAPTSQSASAPAVYLGPDQRYLSWVDTTNASGQTPTVIKVVTSRLDPALLAGTKVDSVVLIIQAKYNGTPLPPSPMRVVIPLKVGAALP